MKFVTHNDKDINANGTSYQGEIDIDFATLKEKFGEPSNGDEYKVDAEWSLEFEDGTIATIYNYKDGKNYNGESGTPTEEIREWHIGGKNMKSVSLVIQILDKACHIH